MTGAEILLRAAEHRCHAEADRFAAAEGRAAAAVDRRRAAGDREQADADRRQAQDDRAALLRQLATAETDALTGASSRGPGLATLEREIDRARRADGRLVVAYLDVVGLKTVNDTLGHTAGDTLLRRVVQAIRAHLRSYDVVVRLGGDEFLCLMPGATVQDAEMRFAAVQDTLLTGPNGCALKVGFADLSARDTAAELIDRADAELPASRGRR